MKYFEPPYTKENLKKQFRTLSKKLHPDTNSASNTAEFIEMLKQYEYCKKKYTAPAAKKPPTPKQKKNNTFVKNIIINVDADSIIKLIKKHLK